MSIIEHAPTISFDQARLLIEGHYDLVIQSIRSLPSERDQNFQITTADDKNYVLKVSNGLEDRSFLDGQDAMLRHLTARIDVCPTVFPNNNGNTVFEVELNGSKHLVRLVSFIDGQPLASVLFRDPSLLTDLGRRMGQISCVLEGFDHPAFHRDFHWDLANARQVVHEKIVLIEDADLRHSIQYFANQFDRHTSKFLRTLPKSVIHNDANDGNVIVSNDHSVVGIIDIGDAVYSWAVGELAIAIAYAILDQAAPLSLATEMVAAFNEESKLQEDELGAIFGLVCMRLCVSAVIAADQQQQRPDDPYLAVSQAPIRRTFPKLMNIPYKIATGTFRQACGLQPVETQATNWLNQKRSYCFPIQIDPKQRRLASLDLSVSSTLLPQDLTSTSVSELTAVINDEMKSNDANIGVGRYLEPRIVYDSEQFGSVDDIEDEKRTIHLGVDLFTTSGSPVIAPLDGTVHGVVYIDLPLDYGCLVILKHEPELGVSFFTLYGHLAARTLDLVSIGQRVDAGETIGWLGDPGENGGWPPHLHFQILLDTLDFEDDFPGVCLASQILIWSAYCPDPNLILGLTGEMALDETTPKSQTLASRKEKVGPSLSIGYESPLKMVRGWKHWLYDETGRKFLDAYNNVPHVGHCHPKIVSSLADQARLLNTNTRYLNDGLNEFARRLSETMPDPLSVCYFVNSGSEANELALRLARTYTGQKDLIVLDGAYHGHTSTMIDISPYKHNGPGGEGAPEWVHVAPLADTYRGQFKDPTTAGKEFATQVSKMIETLDSQGNGLCGFIAESCPSVGGQILFPDGYLTHVYQAVRDAGGVCIADDVQTGYGRLGSAFYGFELQHVVPDIVVLGKPIGNGHPIAAVVTTIEIANNFNNGMEFFSTFGGNTVSCQVGISVLDVVQDEGLQGKALETGEFLLSELNQLKSKHPLIGDVRGSGLFLGIELVRDQGSLEPAAEEASFIVNRMRDRGILIGTDGPLHNVIKIRPPMTFGITEAKMLVSTLDRCFEITPLFE